MSFKKNILKNKSTSSEFKKNSFKNKNNNNGDSDERNVPIKKSSIVETEETKTQKSMLHHYLNKPGYQYLEPYLGKSLEERSGGEYPIKRKK